MLRIYFNLFFYCFSENLSGKGGVSRTNCDKTRLKMFAFFILALLDQSLDAMIIVNLFNQEQFALSSIFLLTGLNY